MKILRVKVVTLLTLLGATVLVIINSLFPCSYSIHDGTTSFLIIIKLQNPELESCACHTDKGSYYIARY